MRINLVKGLGYLVRENYRIIPMDKEGKIRHDSRQADVTVMKIERFSLDYSVLIRIPMEP